MAGERIVLYVDDDQDDLLFLKDALNSIDPSIQIMEATDGLEALKLLNGLKADKKTLPCLNILDLNMPRMDGKECLKAIKQDPTFSHVPVIMYTTSSQSRDIEETMMLGAVCFITKPSSVSDLRNIIATITSTPANDLTKTLRRLSNTSAYIIC